MSRVANSAVIRGSARVLLALAATALGLAVVIEIVGGVNTTLFGIRISAHGFLRPLIAAFALFVAGYARLDRAGRDRLAAGTDRWLRRLPLAVPAAAAVVLALGLRFGSFAAGGADPYGYVSQAQLWRAGHLRVHQDFITGMPWPNADWTFSPLGYRPAPETELRGEGHTLVPTYAPGVSILMALFSIVFGACGPYLVGPFCGAVLVLLTFALGRRLVGPTPAAIAALAIAASPTILYSAFWPMSDVPCATFWTASLLLAMGPSRRAALASGGMAGIAIAIRPNLLPLAALVAALAAWRTPRADGHGKGVAMRVLAFLLGCVPFVLLLGWLFANLYGSPVRSGYGDIGTLYSWEHIIPNLRRYTAWLLETQGPVPFLFVLAPAIGRRLDGARRIGFLFVAAVLAAYLCYLPFDTWMFLRFLLPAFSLAFILAADVAITGASRFGEGARVIATLALCVALVGYGASRSNDLHVLDLGRQEQHYADVGRYVAEQLPANAIVLSLQHSGSIRLYAKRPTLRFDILAADWLDRAAAHLRASGYELYAVLEDFEVQPFRERFAGQTGVSALDGRPLAASEGQQVRVYRMDGTTSAAQTEPIPKTARCVGED